jgi:hypothetical protein
MSRAVRLVVLVMLCCHLAAGHLFADPVTVTSGPLIAPRWSGSASLVGTHGFSLQSRVGTLEGTIDVLNDCLPCAPGSRLSVGGVLSGSVFDGVATLAGTTYPRIWGIDAPASIYMEFSGSTVLPAIQEADVLVTLPFTMQGLFNLPSGIPEVLKGRGLATVLLRSQLIAIDEPRLWRADEVRYDFTSSQTAVPEPSTMILVGGGLLALARRSRRALMMS